VISSVILNDLWIIPLIQALIAFYNVWRSVVDYPFRGKTNHFFLSRLFALLVNPCANGHQFSYFAQNVYLAALVVVLVALSRNSPNFPSLPEVLNSSTCSLFSSGSTAFYPHIHPPHLD
jgi:hypothetical protein